MTQIFFTDYLLQLPSVVVLLIGLAIAVRRRRRHPQISRLSSIAFLIFLLRMLLGPVIRLWIEGSDLPLAEIGMRFAAYNIVSSLLAAGAWVLVLMAIFRWRQLKKRG